MGVPRVEGGPTIGVSSSGELEERPLRPVWRRLGLLPLAILATWLFVPAVLTDLWIVLWAALGLGFIVLILKTWRK